MKNNIILLHLITVFGCCLIYNVCQSQEDDCSSYISESSLFYISHPALPSNVIESSAINELQKFSPGSRVIFKIPVVMHVFRTSNGERGISEDLLYKGMNDLNMNLKEVNMTFFIKKIDTTDNSEYYSHFQDHTDEIISTLNVDNSINVYIAGSLVPFSNVPRTTSPQHYVGLNGQWIRDHPTTWMHEFGHYFGLHHTFGPANIGISGKELVDGSNCDTDGDKICDTPADPKIDEDDESGHNIPQPEYTTDGCLWTGVIRDRNGQLYNPDLSNYMSYQTDCRDHYTIAQKKKIFQTYLKYRHYLDLDIQPIKLFRKEIILPETWNNTKFVRLIGDVTGDGLTDIVSITENNIYVSRRLAGGNFSEAKHCFENLSVSEGRDPILHPKVIGDVNGDQREDLVIFGENFVWVALGRADGSFAPFQKTLEQFTHKYNWETQKHIRLLGDVNGDGRKDIIGFLDNNIFVALAKSDNSGTFQSPINANQIFTYNNGWRKDKHLFFAIDMNKDGKIDIVAIGFGKIHVIFGSQTGTFENPVVSNDPFNNNIAPMSDEYLRKLADVNGDGIPDIVGFGDDNILVSLGELDGSFENSVVKASDFFTKSSGWTGANSQRFLGDFNGDGKADIIGVNESFAFVATGSENGFSKPRVILRPYNESSERTLNKFVYTCTNLNRDHNEDIFGFAGSIVYYVMGRTLQ